MSLIKPLYRILKDDKEVLVFKDIDKISEYAAEEWLNLSENTINSKGYFAAALSGGSTPVGLYRRLAVSERDDLWERTHIFLVDERCVAYEEPESNFRMIRHTLLSRVNIPDDNINPIPTDTLSPESSAAKYEENILTFFKAEEGLQTIFDLVILGIGDDGHTASLFPGTQALSESVRLAVAVTPPDISKKDRVSITLPVINKADHVIFLAAGDEKARVLRDVLERSDSGLPASLVKPIKGTVKFLIDEPASRLLSR
jgi:6-phosphogluconolactonase